MLVYLGCLSVFLQLAFSLPTTPVESYHGHKVLEVFHKTEEDYLKLLKMEVKYGLDFWKMPKHPADSMNVRVEPQHLEAFLEELKTMNVDVNTMIDDVQQMIDAQHIEAKSRRAQPEAMNYRYRSYDEIMQYIEGLNNSFTNGLSVTVETLGQSYEGRAIKMLKISSNKDGSPRRNIFIDGGIHAREWIAPATVLYIIEQLVYQTSPDIAVSEIVDLLSTFDIYLVPVVNPDGYEYTSTSRMWRKNRRVNSGTSCRGVDLNRNFAFQWNPSVGGSLDPCSDIYSGTQSASEPETQAISNYLVNSPVTFDAYLTIHSYGQMWLYPWGYTSALPSDFAELDAAAIAGTQAIRGVHNLRFTVGSSTNVLYSAAGGSDDFAKGTANIKYSYTLELRDTGRYGFILPESSIEPAAKEFFVGFLAFAKVI